MYLAFSLTIEAIFRQQQDIMEDATEWNVPADLEYSRHALPIQALWDHPLRRDQRPGCEQCPGLAGGKGFSGKK